MGIDATKFDEEVDDGTGSSMKMSFDVPSGCALELECFTWYANQPMKFAYAPKFPKKKTYSWWLLLGDAENDELIQMKRVLMETTSRKWQKKVIFDFEAPEVEDDEDPESFVLNLLCSSDSFVGLDQQYDLEINLVPAADGGGGEEGGGDGSGRAGGPGAGEGRARGDGPVELPLRGREDGPSQGGVGAPGEGRRSREEWEDGVDEDDPGGVGPRRLEGSVWG